MKKQWVEVREDGHMIEITSVRRISISRDKIHLYIKYVGEKTLSTINMGTEKAALAGYKKVKDALLTLSKGSK